MRTAFVYYSMEGNTEYAAGKAAEILGADLICIKPQKAYPSKGIRKFIWGGKSAVMGDTPELMPYEFCAEKYDRIVLCTPVWASSFAPPIRSFISGNRNALSGKRFAALFCFSGGGADKASEKLKAYLGIQCFDAELVLIDPKAKPSEENDKKIKEFCASLS